MSTTRRVVITGATGMIGTALCTQLAQKGYELVALTRTPERARYKIPATIVQWDPNDPSGEWTKVLDGAFGVVHLAGAPIFGRRWNASYKAKIRDSRVVSTRTLVDAMAAVEQKPSVFVCGSATGYYGPRDDTELDEQAPAGSDFLASVCVAWEQEATRAEALGIRTVLLRTGIVLGKRKGALAALLPPFRWFVGGPILPGTQWFPWIHLQDEVGLILLALENPAITGPLNAVAPEPKTNRQFCALIGKVLGRPSWLPVPGFVLSLLLGEISQILTTGHRVIPRKALDHGYGFAFPTAEAALRDLLKR